MPSNQIIDPPPNQIAVQDTNGIIDPSWKAFFTTVFTGVSNYQQYGTTAQRPLKGLYKGRTYFDTTLNRPIWYTGTNWIRADGTIV